MNVSILAEGALSETFVVVDSRGMIHKARDFEARYPDAMPVEALYCAPRVEDGFALEALRRRLGVSAGLTSAAAPRDKLGDLRGFIERIEGDRISGWAQSEDRPDVPVCLDILLDGQVVAQTLAERDEDVIQRGANGFDLRLSAPLTDAEAGRIIMRRSADGAPLPWVGQPGRSMDRMAARAS